MAERDEARESPNVRQQIDHYLEEHAPKLAKRNRDDQASMPPSGSNPPPPRSSAACIGRRPISASAAALLRTIRLRVPEDCEWVFQGEAQGKPLQKHGVKKWEPVFGNRHAARKGTSSGSGKMSVKRLISLPFASMICATPSRRCLFRAA
jgi:hypothetical protein